MFKYSHLIKKKINTANILAIIFFISPCLTANEYIVKLKYDLENHPLSDLIISTEPSYRITDQVTNFDMLKVDVDIRPDDFDDPKEILMKYFDAEYVVENVPLHAFLDGADPKRAEQWALDTIQAEQAWNISRGSHNVVVAVIDTGIAVEHEDLRSNIWTNTDEVAGNGVDDDNNGFVDDIHGWDFKGNDNDPHDETGGRNPGHGSHCAGIIGAACGNGVGVCGISPLVSLMPIRFLGADGSGDLFASVKAIDYAISNDAHIISASWGATVPQSTAQPIIDAIKRAEDGGLIFIAAAANDGKSNDTSSVYPANAQTPNMIAVAASNNLDEKPTWSNFGRKVDIAAPGADILSTVPNGYTKLSGTSMATPLVAGTVALMKSVDMTLSGAVARSILQATGKAVNIETASKRRIDALQALEAVKNKKLTVVPAALTLAKAAEFDFSAWGGSPPYRFKSLNPEVATISEAGHLVAVSDGDVVIEVSDANSASAQSVSIKVAQAPSDGGSSCPLPDELLCAIMCGINPQFPWCKDMPELPIP